MIKKFKVMFEKDASAICQVRIREEFILNNANVQIYTRTWEPADVQPKAVIVFVHGHAEHVTRYDDVFKHFSEAGLKVQGFDQVGCGKTGERSNDLGGAFGLSRVMLDINDAIDRAYTPDIPLFLMGHSFGGLAILNYLAVGDRRDLVYGAIAIAPCLQVANEAMPYFPLKMLVNHLASLFPHLKVPVNINSTFLSREEDEVRKYSQDPLIFSRSSLIQVRDLLFEGELFMLQRYSQIQVSRLLIIHGTADKITAHDASVAIYKRLKEEAKISHLEFKSYEGGYHELMNDSVKKEVISHLLAWILKQI